MNDYREFYKFPNDWAPITLLNSTYLKGRIGWQGLKASEFTIEGPYLVTGTNFVNGSIDWENCYRITKQRFEEAPTIHLKEDDLLITKDGTIGKIALVKDCPDEAILNSGIFLLRCKDQTYRHAFLFYFLLSDYFKKYLYDTQGGSTIVHLYQREFERFTFRAPKIPEQERIAEILSTADEAIERTQALIDKYSRIKRGLMQDLLTRGIDENGNIRNKQTHKFTTKNGIEVPEDWDVVRLDEIAEIKRGKFTHRPRNEPRFYGGEFPFIQTGDISRCLGRTLNDFTQTLNEEGIKISKKFPKDTIVISIAANIGDTAILGREMYLTDSVVGVTVNESQMPRFVEMWLRKNKEMLSATAPQSAQKNINLETLKPLPIPFVSFDEQIKIVQTYESELRVVEELENNCLKLQVIKKGLMQDLLSGRKRVKMD